MSTATIIRCSDCGSDYETVRKNTKYCRLCRTLRDIKFIGVRQQTCWECDQKFAPSGPQQFLCGACDTTPRKSYVTGTCALCNRQEARLLDAQVAVCVECSRDGGKRPAFFKALVKKQARLREANGGEE